MFLCLSLLDMLMDKCATPFHSQVGNKEFMQVLITVLNSKELPREVSFIFNPNQVQQKVVYLIQKWGLKFESSHDQLPLFFDVYNALKKSGVQFPAVSQN